MAQPCSLLYSYTVLRLLPGKRGGMFLPVFCASPSVPTMKKPFRGETRGTVFFRLLRWPPLSSPR